MIPCRVTAASKAANESPSAALERGAYRMRAPRLRRESNLSSHSGRSPTRTLRGGLKEGQIVKANKAMVAVLFVLAFACLASFGAAYYLFTTRWDSPATPRAFAPADAPLQVNASRPLVGPNDRYLAYFPHSGFHNQRIAFENALVLASLLNRTLLVPSVRLGIKPFRYVQFDALRDFLLLSSKTGLLHCPNVPAYISTPLECLDYFDYSHVPWTFFFDLSHIEARQRLLYQDDLLDLALLAQLKIDPENTLTLRDESPYHYRLVESKTISSAHTKFTEEIGIPELSTSTARLIQIGTMFGSSRLRLSRRASRLIRSNIRQSFVFSNPALVHVAGRIKRSLGDNYIGIHIRSGDGEFQRKTDANVRQMWWILMHQILGISVDEAAAIENDFLLSTGSTIRDMISPVLPNDTRNSGPPLPISDYTSANSKCRRKLQDNPHPNRTNRTRIPLFVATDLKNPKIHPLLGLLRHSFRCIFFLSDFAPEISYLDSIRKPRDGVELKPFLLPFIDAMVVGHARRVVVTEGSTFSRYVRDVLWTTYHSLPIVERG